MIVNMTLRGTVLQAALIPPRRFRLAQLTRPLRQPLHTPSSPPHAYLEPLAMTDMPKLSPEFEGVMCLVLDRQDARNALSIRMVGVRTLLLFSHLQVKHVITGQS